MRGVVVHDQTDAAIGRIVVVQFIKCVRSKKKVALAGGFIESIGVIALGLAFGLAFGWVESSWGCRGVREAAKERKRERFTALLHHLSIDLLRESFYALKRQAAPGVGGVRWSD